MEVVVDSFWKNKRVLVTGHTGFKGAWLAFWLKQLGAEVMGYALPPSTSPSLYASLNLGRLLDREVLGDIIDFDLLQQSLLDFKPELVFHLAAKALVRESYAKPVDTYSTNLMGTVFLLDALRKVSELRSILVVTSDKCYLNTGKGVLFTEIDSLGGHDPYSSSKACQEHISHAYAQSYFLTKKPHRVGLATARGGNVIGGGDWSEDRLVPDLIKAIVEDKTVIIRKPDSIRPWQHVLDCLAGYLSLSQKLHEDPVNYSEAFNFASRKEDSISVLNLVEKLFHYMGRNSNYSIGSEDDLFEQPHLMLDSAKSISRLGWDQKISIEKTLELTAEWYRDYYGGGDVASLCRDQIRKYDTGN